MYPPLGGPVTGGVHEITAEEEPVAPGTTWTFLGESDASAGGEEGRADVQVIVTQIFIDTVMRKLAAWLGCGIEKSPRTIARTKRILMGRRLIGFILSVPPLGFKESR